MTLCSGIIQYYDIFDLQATIYCQLTGKSAFLEVTITNTTDASLEHFTTFVHQLTGRSIITRTQRLPTNQLKLTIGDTRPHQHTTMTRHEYESTMLEMTLRENLQQINTAHKLLSLDIHIPIRHIPDHIHARTIIHHTELILDLKMRTRLFQTNHPYLAAIKPSHF